MKQPLLVIAAGGTGGHMFPAQALAEEMLSKEWRVKLTTDARGARYVGGFPDGVEIVELSSATFARGGILAKLMAPFRIGAGIISATFGMIFDRPNVVVGFGGYPSIPALAAAWILRRPRMIHEQNGVLGRVNQVFAKRVNTIACGTWPTKLPEGVEGIHTGNPVRRAIRDKEAAAYIPPGDYPMDIVVVGGSQGARILSEIVPKAIGDLPDELKANLRVAHQARPEDIEAAQQGYDAAGVTSEVASFFDDIPRRFSEAQLIISRAGASTVADIATIGRPSILVPLAAAIRDEQTANARGLVNVQASIMIPEKKFTPAIVTEHIKIILDHPEAALKMSIAALSAGRPDATEQLVELVELLNKKKKK